MLKDSQDSYLFRFFKGHDYEKNCKFLIIKPSFRHQAQFGHFKAQKYANKLQKDRRDTHPTRNLPTKYNNIW